MNESITPERWSEMVRDLHAMIVSEIEDTTDPTVSFPKLVTMYQFFRLVRGEAFHAMRPAETDPKEAYGFEDDIAARLEALATKLDPSDGRTSFYIEEAKRRFDPKDFVRGER